MKRLPTLYLLLPCLFGLLFLSFINRHPDTDCRELYEKILATQNAVAGSQYQKFTTQTIMDGKAGLKTTTEVWAAEGNSLFRNELITIFQKEGEQLLIMHSSHKILFKKAEPAEETGEAKPAQFSYDSLVKYAISIQCLPEKDKQQLIVVLPQVIRKEQNLLKQISYTMKEGQLKKLVMKYYGQQEQQDVYEYLECSPKANMDILKASLEEQVYENGKKLKPAYRGYEVKDLRNADLLKDRK